MRLTILGYSGSIVGPYSAASGYLVESGDTRIMLDLGNGTLGALQRHLDPLELDGLFFSHLHPDHCADFGALTVLRRYRPNPSYDTRAHRLPVIAPEYAPQRFANLYAPTAEELAVEDLSDVFDFRPITPEPVRIGPFTVTAVPMAHLCPTWGYRVEAEGRLLAYTGDTGPCGELAELARDADVFLAEASWEEHPTAPANVHLSGHQAAQAARDAGVRRLLLTHLVPWTDHQAILAEARATFPGPTELVASDVTYEI